MASFYCLLNRYPILLVNGHINNNVQWPTTSKPTSQRDTFKPDTNIWQITPNRNAVLPCASTTTTPSPKDPIRKAGARAAGTPTREYPLIKNPRKAWKWPVDSSLRNAECSIRAGSPSINNFPPMTKEWINNRKGWIGNFWMRMLCWGASWFRRDKQSIPWSCKWQKERTK